MPTLYLAQDGVRVQREGEQLVARLDGDEAARVPLEWLDLVVLQGTCHLTQPALLACLARGVPVAYLSPGGEFLGRLEPPAPRVARVQRAQLRFCEDGPACLALAQTVVHAKLRNAHTVLRRSARGAEGEAALARIAAAAAGTGRAGDLDALRGWEGAGAAAYFQAWVAGLEAQWGFAGRRYRPAPDPVNAALNFVYALLRSRIAGAIAAAGLNPYLGFFHADREGHATLASDMMEEWRPAVADRVVLAAIEDGLLRLEHADLTPEGDHRLGMENRRALIALWERKLEERITLPCSGTPGPLRAAFLQQVLHLSRHMQAPADEPYQPWRVR
ncbi:MAG: CRISPR-associated endonuclease Cas1 [Candidatus Sericytochromatia bacterium]|nr:CRISPR-associated endonuclease Cas1 [Candidatus Sericytochromatia bacterium]